MVHNYLVIVGNVGCVYNGHNQQEALSNFRSYAAISCLGRGRAGNEDVLLLDNNHVVREYHADVKES